MNVDPRAKRPWERFKGQKAWFCSFGDLLGTWGSELGWEGLSGEPRTRFLGLNQTQKPPRPEQRYMGRGWVSSWAPPGLPLPPGWVPSHIPATLPSSGSPLVSTSLATSLFPRSLAWGDCGHIETSHRPEETPQENSMAPRDF